MTTVVRPPSNSRTLSRTRKLLREQAPRAVALLMFGVVLVWTAANPHFSSKQLSSMASHFR